MEQLALLRKEMDEIDRELTQVFLRRLDVAAEIGAYKQQIGLPGLDQRRELQVIRNASAQTEDAGRKLELVADAENRDTCYACADSTAQCDLRPGDVLTVTAAPQKLQLITFYDSEQFHAIENKLMRS